MADNRDMQTEYNLFADVWQLLKKNYEPSEQQAYWSELLKDTHEIEAKYKNKLCDDLLVAVVMELERKFLKEREEIAC
jgi:hypothetical protein